MKASIDGLTAWTNVRLASKNCQADNILKDIMEGQRMKTLLECEHRRPASNMRSDITEQDARSTPNG